MEGTKVIARFLDGRMLKGHSLDFRPTSDRFHVYAPEATLDDRPEEVTMDQLKAVFIVRDFEGKPGYAERKEFEEPEPLTGRPARVTFKDGEVLVGSTAGQDRHRPGFFLFPADKDSNNIRIYIVNKAVQGLEFLA